MATSTDLQQALALRKGNPTLTTAEAVAQVRSTMPAAPAPIAPAVAPITPPAPLAPAPMVQSPVDATTGLSKPLEASSGQVTPAPAPVKAPVTPAPVKAPVTPAPVKPTATAPIVNRQQEIQNNLATGYQTNPALFTDRAAYDKAYNYATKKPEEQATLDSFYSSKQPTISSMFSGILAKQDIPDAIKQTPAYKIANIQYYNAQNFAGMTPSALSKEMNTGKIVEGSQTWENMKAMNPKLAQDATNLRIVNKDKTSIYTTNQDGTKTNNLETLFGNEFSQMFGSFMDQMFKVQTPEQIKSQIYTPDVQKAQEKAQGIEVKMNDLQTQIDTIDKDVEAELKGSGATGSRIALEKASRKGLLTDQYNALNRQYTTQYNIQSQLITQNTATMQTIQQQQTARNNAMMPFIKDKYDTQQEKIKAEQALNDPATQISQTMQEFAKMGIVAQGNTASKMAEFKSSGKTLPEYIQGLRAQFMSKPEYQKMLSLKQGELSDVQKLSMQNANEDRRDSRNFAQQMQLAKYNNDSARSKFLFEIENDPEKKAKALELERALNANKSLFDVLGKNVGTYKGNRGYDLAGALGDPLPAGGNWTVKSVGTAGEQVGSIFIGGKGSKPYGNTVVMTDENGNEIRYSHLQDIGVKQGDVLGFGDIVGTRGNTGNVMGANGEKLTTEQLVKGRGAHLDIEIKSGGKLLSNKDQVSFLKGLTASSGGVKASSLPLYRAYMEDGKLPSKDALKGLSISSEQFTESAQTGYDSFLTSKAKEINATYPTLQIEFTPSYSTLSATQREKLNESMTKIGDIDMRLEKLKTLFGTNGTEVLPTKAKKEMQSLKQQIILKAKEVENLGVLNGPDLGILESLIPETTGIMSGLFSFDSNTQTTLDSIQKNYRSDAKTKGINYGARISFKGSNEPVSTAPTSTEPIGNTNKGGGQLSQQAQSIEQKWLSRKK